jgi:hypothetical protein
MPKRSHARSRSGDHHHMTTPLSSHDPHDHVVKELLASLPDEAQRMNKEEKSLFLCVLHRKPTALFDHSGIVASSSRF